MKTLTAVRKVERYCTVLVPKSTEPVCVFCVKSIVEKGPHKGSCPLAKLHEMAMRMDTK